MALMHNMNMNNMMTNIHIKNKQEYMKIVTSMLKTKNDSNGNGSSRSDFMNSLTRPCLPSAILLTVGSWNSWTPIKSIEADGCRVNRCVDFACDMGTPGVYYGSAYLNGYVYMVRGIKGTDYLNSVRQFDPIRKIWQKLAPMNDKRFYVSTAVLENQIYTMGEFDS